MGLVGAAVTFRLANFYQGALATALKEELVSVSKEIELHLEPPKSYVRLLYLDWHYRNRDLGLWGSAGRTDFLSLSPFRGISDRQGSPGEACSTTVGGLPVIGPLLRSLG